MCEDESPVEVYCGLKYLILETNFCHTADQYFFVGNALCFLHWNNKIFPSETGVDGICFGGSIENLKAAINNREHCKEPP